MSLDGLQKYDKNIATNITYHSGFHQNIQAFKFEPTDNQITTSKSKKEGLHSSMSI